MTSKVTDKASPETKRPRPAWVKRKVAIMMGYCGTGYQGMQMNPGANTIEKELFTALVDEQLVSEDNAADPHKVSWMRACRTDKGVHACGQVVSVKILLRDNYDGLEGSDERTVLSRTCDALNERLPDSIRIFGIKRTTGSFHAKERTDSRIYEYLLPTYTLRPVDPASYTVEGEGGRAEEWDGVTPQISEEERRATTEFRCPADLLSKTRELFKTYIGVHPYHNFTVGIAATEMRANRHIHDVHVGEPFLQDGLEWIRVRFHGQSFMLHQIRKMVGLVVMAVRLGAGPAIVEKCLKKPVKVNIPRAPALGLLLDRALFDQYNERNEKSLDSNAGHDRIDFMEYETEREALKNELIYPKIYAEEVEWARFWGWLKCNDDHAADFSFLTKP